MYGKAAGCKSTSAVSRRSSSTDLGPATFIDANASVAGATCTRQLSLELCSQDSIHWPTAAAPDEVVVMKYSSAAMRAVTPSSSTTPSSPHIRPYWAEPTASAIVLMVSNFPCVGPIVEVVYRLTNSMEA